MLGPKQTCANYICFLSVLVVNYAYIYNKKCQITLLAQNLVNMTITDTQLWSPKISCSVNRHLHQ